MSCDHSITCLFIVIINIIKKSKSKVKFNIKSWRIYKECYRFTLYHIITERPWSFHMLCRKSLTIPSVLTIVWVGTKCTVLDTEFIAVITILNSTNSGSSMTKSTLIVFHYVFEMRRKCSLLMDRCQVGLVLI